MAADLEIEVAVAVVTPSLLGESPVWLAESQTLWYCDIPARRLHRFDPARGERRDWSFDADIGSFAPMCGGGFIVALRDGLWHFDPDTDTRRLLAAAPYDTVSRRFNDGRCDAAGRFWVGTMDEPRRAGHAALYCFDGGKLTQRQDGIAISNGLAWSPDGNTMYWTDTLTHTVWAFDFRSDTGAMSGRRVFAQFASRPEGGGEAALERYHGRPDGAAVDAEGCYWVAMYDGGRVLRLSPAGEILTEVRIPSRCPTMPCFGGADMKTVYVTSASARRPAGELERLPNSGSVFSFRADVPGLPVEFAASVPR